MKKKLFFLVLIILLGCTTSKVLTNDYYAEDKEVNLFAFVGKKISIVEFDPNAEQIGAKIYDSTTGDTFIRKRHIMDGGYRCKYAVIKNVFNNPKIDTIDFVAYDHYGKPAFSEHETVLLYISKNAQGSGFFHQKYQFDYLEKNNVGKFYGFVYDIEERKKRTVFKNKRIADLEVLFSKKKEGVFKVLFDRKNGN